MIYEIEVDTSQTDPRRAVKYIGEIKDFKPFDPRFFEIKIENGLGVRTEKNGTKTIVAVTDEPGKKGFMYTEIDNFFLKEILSTMIGKNNDRLAVMEHIIEMRKAERQT